MTLVRLLVQIGIIVGAMLGLAALAIVGWSRLVRIRRQYRKRAITIAPYLVLLGCVLLLNNVTRKFGQEVSWMIGWNITGIIYAIEGTLITSLQSIETSLLTTYFSFMYVYGYVFVLVFPLIAYFALDEIRFLRETCIAYTLNYGIGLLCYVAFISYGPRNLMPDMVQSLLYMNWPQSQLLTSQVNTNTNVFPSLHSSLSITVMILAYRTREHYPKWLFVATVFSASIIISTMYLGIHWLIDVIAGGALALFAVWVPINLDKTTPNRYRSRVSVNRVSVPHKASSLIPVEA